MLYRSVSLALVLLAAACGGSSPEAQVPTTDVAPPPPAPAPPVVVAPPAEPAPMVAPPPEAPLQAKQGDVAKEDGEEGVMRARAQVEAEANAAQRAKDKPKWEKMGRDIERKAADQDAHDRLARATARVANAQNQLSRVPAHRRGKYNTDLVTFGTKKADVQSRISSIYSYGSDEWNRMRVELDRALDELERAAGVVEGDLF